MAPSAVSHRHLNLIDLPIEIQLNIFRHLMTRKPDSKRWKHRSECFIDQDFPFAAMAVCRQFHALGKHLFLAEIHQVGINVATNSNEMIGLDLLQHPLVCAGIRTVYLTVAFYSEDHLRHRTREPYAEARQLMSEIGVALARLSELEEVKIAILDMEYFEPILSTTQEMCDTLRCLKRLPQTVGYELEGFLSLFRSDQRQQVLRQLGAAVEGKVEDRHDEVKMIRLFWPRYLKLKQRLCEVLARR